MKKPLFLFQSPYFFQKLLLLKLDFLNKLV